MSNTIIKADSGWYVAEFFPGGKNKTGVWEDHLDLDPIIAWRIEGACRVLPITVNGIYDENPTEFVEPALGDQTP